MSVPVRKLPAILRELTGIEVTQSALTQDALKKSEGVVGNAYQALRTGVATCGVVPSASIAVLQTSNAIHLSRWDGFKDFFSISGTDAVLALILLTKYGRS